MWLKEGFATAVGWQAIDHIFPEWDAMNMFLKYEYEEGLQLDALLSTHPICVQVSKPAEVSQIFDAISYNKGASLIRMLSGYVGERAFGQGVNAYLKKHAYSNATTEDLWSALSVSSGKDISSMMSNWTMKPGFPLLVVEDQTYNPENGEMTVNLSQKRFLTSQQTDDTSWFVPILIRTSKFTSTHTLMSPSAKITFNCAKGDLWIMDAGCTGFFRIRYLEEHLRAIGGHLGNSSSEFLSGQDKFSLISDSFSCFKAGILKISTLLEFLKCFEGEKDCYIVDKLIGCMNELKRLFYLEPEIILGLNRLQRDLVLPLISIVGYNWPVGESFKETALRTTVLQTASAVKVERYLKDNFSVLAEFYKDYWKFLSRETNSVNSNIRAAVLSSVLRHSPNSLETFDQLFLVYQSSQDLEERQDIFQAMASSNQPQVLDKYLTLLNDPAIVRSQDVNSCLYAISRNSPLGQIAFEKRWDWFTANFHYLQDRFVPDSLPIRGCMEGIIGDAMIKQIEDWISVHKDELFGVASYIQQELELMKQNTVLYERNRVQLLQWLDQQM